MTRTRTTLGLPAGPVRLVLAVLGINLAVGLVLVLGRRRSVNR